MTLVRRDAVTTIAALTAYQDATMSWSDSIITTSLFVAAAHVANLSGVNLPLPAALMLTHRAMTHKDASNRSFADRIMTFMPVQAAVAFVRDKVARTPPSVHKGAIGIACVVTTSIQVAHSIGSLPLFAASLVARASLSPRRAAYFASLSYMMLLSLDVKTALSHAAPDAYEHLRRIEVDMGQWLPGYEASINAPVPAYRYGGVASEVAMMRDPLVPVVSTIEGYAICDPIKNVVDVHLCLRLAAETHYDQGAVYFLHGLATLPAHAIPATYNDLSIAFLADMNEPQLLMRSLGSITTTLALLGLQAEVINKQEAILASLSAFVVSSVSSAITEDGTHNPMENMYNTVDFDEADELDYFSALSWIGASMSETPSHLARTPVVITPTSVSQVIVDLPGMYLPPKTLFDKPSSRDSSDEVPRTTSQTRQRRLDQHDADQLAALQARYPRLLFAMALHAGTPLGLVLLQNHDRVRSYYRYFHHILLEQKDMSLLNRLVNLHDMAENHFLWLIYEVSRIVQSSSALDSPHLTHRITQAIGIIAASRVHYGPRERMFIDRLAVVGAVLGTSDTSLCDLVCYALIALVVGGLQTITFAFYRSCQQSIEASGKSEAQRSVERVIEMRELLRSVATSDYAEPDVEVKIEVETPVDTVYDSWEVHARHVMLQSKVWEDRWENIQIARADERLIDVQSNEMPTRRTSRVRAPTEPRRMSRMAAFALACM